ncbi:MAG: hypothetical protein FWE31_04310, partial [Firmicutes bacterium]|nr:hypothetical protein [Bacillota bacterium]
KSEMTATKNALLAGLTANKIKTDALTVTAFINLGLTRDELMEFKGLDNARISAIQLSLGIAPDSEILPGNWIGTGTPWAERSEESKQNALLQQKNRRSQFDTTAPQIEDTAVIEFQNPTSVIEEEDRPDYVIFEETLDINQRPAIIKSDSLSKIHNRYFGGDSHKIINETYLEFFTNQLTEYEQKDLTEDAIYAEEEKLSALIDKVGGIINAKTEEFYGIVEAMRTELAEATERKRVAQLKEDSVSNLRTKVDNFRNKNLKGEDHAPIQ